MIIVLFHFFPQFLSSSTLELLIVHFLLQIHLFNRLIVEQWQCLDGMPNHLFGKINSPFWNGPLGDCCYLFLVLWAIVPNLDLRKIWSWFAFFNFLCCKIKIDFSLLSYILYWFLGMYVFYSFSNNISTTQINLLSLKRELLFSIYVQVHIKNWPMIQWPTSTIAEWRHTIIQSKNKFRMLERWSKSKFWSVGRPTDPNLEQKNKKRPCSKFGPMHFFANKDRTKSPKIKLRQSPILFLR